VKAAELQVAQVLPLDLETSAGRLRLMVGAGPLKHSLFTRGTDHDNRGRVSFIDLAWTGT